MFSDINSRFHIVTFLILYLQVLFHLQVIFYIYWV